MGSKSSQAGQGREHSPFPASRQPDPEGNQISPVLPRVKLIPGASLGDRLCPILERLIGREKNSPVWCVSKWP